MNPSARKTTIDYFKKKYSPQIPSKLSEELRKQARIKVNILKAISRTPKTVPEISEETGLPPHIVFWYLMTFHKYGLVEAVEKNDEGYYKYMVVRRR